MAHRTGGAVGFDEAPDPVRFCSLPATMPDETLLLPRRIAGPSLRLLILTTGLASAAVSGEERALPVRVALAEAGEDFAKELVFTGTVTSPRRANLSTRTEGLVEEIAVDAGSVVRKGDVLMTLDTRLARIGLELVEAELEQAEIELAEAKRRAEEVRDLARSGGFARSEAEARVAVVRVAEASLKRLEVRRAEQAEIIDRHRLLAPFDGVVNRKIAEAGEWVATGAPVAELVETDRLRFDIQVPQESLASVHDADSVMIRLDAYPDEAIAARIEVVVPVQDNVSRTFLTRLSLEDGEQLASPGMSGAATIVSRPDGRASVRVPRDAVVRDPDGRARVWVVVAGEDGPVASSREVRTAGYLGETAEVVEGLRGGERVVVEGNEALREDQPVEILPAEPDAPAP